MQLQLLPTHIGTYTLSSHAWAPHVHAADCGLVCGDVCRHPTTLQFVAWEEMRVCVLQSSYEGSNADTKDLDPARTPQVYDTGVSHATSLLSVLSQDS